MENQSIDKSRAGNIGKYLKYAIGEIVLEFLLLRLIAKRILPLLGGDKGVGNMMRKTISYNPDFLKFAENMRNNMPLEEIAM